MTDLSLIIVLGLQMYSPSGKIYSRVRLSQYEGEILPTPQWVNTYV